MTEEEREIRQRLKDDLAHYAPRCLKIRTKSGTVEPFAFNQAQEYVHAKLEAQRQATGKVRALILKARQQGFSTYISGRFYHRVTHAPGLQCFILTHEQAATDNLFGMVDRYHRHNHPLVKPSTGAIATSASNTPVITPRFVRCTRRRRPEPITAPRPLMNTLHG